MPSPSFVWFILDVSYLLTILLLIHFIWIHLFPFIRVSKENAPTNRSQCITCIGRGDKYSSIEENQVMEMHRYSTFYTYQNRSERTKSRGQDWTFFKGNKNHTSGERNKRWNRKSNWKEREEINKSERWKCKENLNKIDELGNYNEIFVQITVLNRRPNINIESVISW